ncbi:MAG: hypothetical protein ACKVS6_12930 [Planctomycetota bacterium]
MASSAIANKTRNLLLLTGAFAAAFLFYFRPIQDDDAWLHFAAGRWILDNGAVQSVDTFSCTAPGVRYVNHEWLAQVVFESVRRIFGIPGFRILIAACAGISFVIITISALRHGAGRLAAGLITISALALQWHVARARPQVFTMICVALLVDQYILRADALRARRVVFFVILMIFWANVHAAAVIAPGLLGLACVGSFLAGSVPAARRLGFLAIASALLLLVNPYGYHVYSYAFQTQGLAALIPEWKSLWTLLFDPMERARQTGGSDFRTQAIYLSILALLTIPLAAWTILKARRGRSGEPDGGGGIVAFATPAAVCSILPFIANRHDLFIALPVLFVCIALPQIAKSETRARTAVRAAGWVAGILAFAALARDADYRSTNYQKAGVHLFSNFFPPHEPEAAVNFIEKAGIEGNCLNRPSWGGYLLYRLYPQVKVSFDGRITTLGAGVYKDHIDFFNGLRCSEIAEKYQFDFAIVLPFVFGFSKPFDQPNYVAPNLLNDWEIVYRDAHPNQEGAAVVALRKLSPRFEENLARVRAARVR